MGVLAHMSVSKVIFTVESVDRLKELQDTHRLTECITAIASDGTVAVCAYPRHHHTRFALADEEGVTVLPAAGDPAPIGEVHRSLASIDAQPEQTARDVLLSLYEKHGAAFHPDT